MALETIQLTLKAGALELLVLQIAFELADLLPSGALGSAVLVVESLELLRDAVDLFLMLATQRSQLAAVGVALQSGLGELQLSPQPGDSGGGLVQSGLQLCSVSSGGIS